MYFQLQSTPPSLKFTNAMRLVQFIVKLALYWWIFIDTLFTATMTSLGLLQIIFSGPFFVWYEFWRIGYLIKRINMYILQWSFSIFDITAFTMVKCYYFYHTSETLNTDFSTFFAFLSYFYILYLILPCIIFTTWLLTFCKMRQATKEMQELSGLGGVAGDLVSHLPNHVTIQSIALQNKCIRVLVYLNIFFAFAIALATTIGSLLFYAEENLSASSIIFAAIVMELVDLVLNILEDRVVCYYASEPAAKYFIETPLPGFGCCCCRTLGSMDMSGASIPMLE